MWDIARGPVPEEVISDPTVATSNGYGASKFVTENVRDDLDAENRLMLSCL
jgi:UDP-glucose 4-epimerase